MAMMGFGWCHLRSSREALRGARLEDVDAIDEKIDKADRLHIAAFRAWMKDMEAKDPWLKWDLQDELNSARGLLTYTVSRNHRSSGVWEMLEWIREHARGSYGLFYCHDAEDAMDSGHSYNRHPPADFDNVYRVHRLKHGKLEELADPFFGLIDGDLDPVHPYDVAGGEDPDGEA